MGRGGVEAPRLPCRGETSTFSSILVAENDRFMGTGGDREGLFPSFHLQPSTVRASGNSAAERSLETGTSRARSSVLDEQGCRGDCNKWERLRGLLLPLLLGPQERWVLEANSQSERSKPPFEVRQVPHGDLNVHSSVCQSRRLDVQPGSERCLSTCSDSPSAPQIPAVCVQKSYGRTDYISVEGPPIRALDRSKSVYQTNSPISRADTLEGTCTIPLHRRHVWESPHQSAGTGSQKCGPANINVGGLCDKPGKICSGTHPGHDTSRGQDQVRPGTGDPASVKSRPISQSGSRDVSPRPGHSQTVLEIYRAHDSMHANDPALLVQDASFDDPFTGPLQTGSGSVEHNDSVEIDLPDTGDFILDGQNQFGDGNPAGSPCSQNYSFHRCISPRMGGCVSGPNLLGCMVSPRLEEPHKHAGDEGSVVHSAALRDEAAESVSSNINGQHHSDGLPQQRRRHSLQVAKCASQGSDKLVFGPIDAISMRTCAGGRQCTSGCIVATMANATQRQLSQCGVVDGPGSSESNIPEVGQAVNRPVCHGAEQEALQVLQPGAPPLGRTNTSDGTALGQKSGVCFPPNGTGNDVHTQNTQRGSRSHSRATLVAEKGLVPHSAGGNSRTSHSASRSSRSVARPTGHGASRPRDPPVNRLEGLRESLKTSGISQEAATTIEAAHRPSTRALYKRKWEVFRVWCDRRHVNPVHPPIRKVINYLQHLLSVPIKVATILTHISALSVCCDPIEGASIGNHPMVKTWVKGSKALNPRIRTLMPAWSLPVILSALREQPYEPMAKADLKHLTLKTTFLLAITSARRISELQALCMAEPFLIINPASAFLRVNNAFLPKVPSDLALNADIELQAFYPNPHTGVEKEQRKNCPIRALNYYLAATKLIRKENLNLFVNFTDKAQGSPASKRVISTWIAEVIRAAYHVMGHTDPLSIRANPHSLRGVATTYAELAAVSPAEICRAATWSKYCMFSRAYRLDSIAKGNFGAAVLKTASQVR